MSKKYTITVELAPMSNPDLSLFGQGDQSSSIATQLNNDKERLYVTNSQKLYNLVSYKLMPHAKERLILVQLSNKHGSVFIPVAGDIQLLSSTMGDSKNFVVINALGVFDTIVRNKLISLSTGLPHIQLNLISNLVASGRDSKTLVIPNNCNNLVFSTILKELISNRASKITVATAFSLKASSFLEHPSLEEYKDSLTESDLELLYHDLETINLNDYDRIYLDVGEGVTDAGYQNIIDNTLHAQQLSILNHKYLNKYSSASELEFDTIVTDDMLCSPVAVGGYYEIPGVVARQSHAMNPSSSISTNPLD